jgi:hypothetical protein
MTVGSYKDGPIMSPNLTPAGLRGARFQAVFARSSYVGIGWNLWGFLPHFLPHLISLKPFLLSIRSSARRVLVSWRAGELGSDRGYRISDSRAKSSTSPRLWPS